MKWLMQNVIKNKMIKWIIVVLTSVMLLVAWIAVLENSSNGIFVKTIVTLSVSLNLAILLNVVKR